jgi:hypothetical protein
VAGRIRRVNPDGFNFQVAYYGLPSPQDFCDRVIHWTEAFGGLELLEGKMTDSPCGQSHGVYAGCGAKCANLRPQLELALTIFLNGSDHIIC